ncbi:MAG TPA: chemotaxis protein CheW [Myxococcales bacterium]|nr:chemotaxis protein CheW [Myxococcales bacterium]
MKITPRTAEPVTEQQLQLLERRAARLREKPPAQSDESVLWAAEFPIGDESYALPLQALRAAVPLKMVTPVPLSPPHVIGILRFQGQILTAMSLASLLGGRGWREDPAVLLVVDPGMGGRLFALDCERIPKPISLPMAAVEEARSRVKGPLADVTLPGLQQVNLIDLQRLMERRSSEKRRA